MIKTSTVSKKTNQTLDFHSHRSVYALYYSVCLIMWMGEGDEKLVEEVGIFICGGNSV